MKIEELFSRLSYAELSNLSIGNEGRGSIQAENTAKIIAHINDGLLRLYSRFVLSSKQLMLIQAAHITNYHLVPKFAESTGSEEPYAYIKDLPEEPFLGDVIRVLGVIDEFGDNHVLNDRSNPKSFFTPAPQLLQVPDPKEGRPLTVEYQARHIILNNEDLEQEITIPFVLEGALQSFIAYKIFSHMNGQDNQQKSQEHLSTYEGICMDVENRDLVNETFHTSHHKLEERGFV